MKASLNQIQLVVSWAVTFVKQHFAANTGCGKPLIILFYWCMQNISYTRCFDCVIVSRFTYWFIYLQACLDVLNTVLCYSFLPTQCLDYFIAALCRLVNLAHFCQSSWDVSSLLTVDKLYLSVIYIIHVMLSMVFFFHRIFVCNNHWNFSCEPFLLISLTNHPYAT